MQYSLSATLKYLKMLKNSEIIVKIIIVELQMFYTESFLKIRQSVFREN